MTECTTEQMIFSFYDQKPLTATFNGGDISSDGGLVFLRQLESRFPLIDQLVCALTDSRDRRYITHEARTMLRQRVFQIACNYSDCNDATTMRHDAILKLCCNADLATGDALASQPTLSRLENSVTNRDLYRIGEALVAAYLSTYTRRPKKIILDVDTTDDPTYGGQQLSFFNGFYGTYMYHPMIVSDGQKGTLIAAVLRPGNAGNSNGALAVLKRIIQKIRERWRGIRIIIRADAGFAIPELYDYCENEDILYIVGFQATERLKTLNKTNLDMARNRYTASKKKVRRLTSTQYRANSWRKQRRVLMKSEVTAQGDNQRFVVTNMRGRSLDLYDFYGGRGQMENQVIKEFKLDLNAGRLSCHRFAANQFRLFLHASAYQLLHALRCLLHGTELASARIDRIRSTVLKIGVRVRNSVRRVWVDFASGYPLKGVLRTLFTRLNVVPSSA